MAAGMNGFRLSQYKWEGGKNFEELVTWGITPAIALMDILDGMEDNESLSNNPAVYLILNDLKCKLEDIEVTIYRFIHEKAEEEKQGKGKIAPQEDEKAPEARNPITSTGSEAR